MYFLFYLFIFILFLWYITSTYEIENFEVNKNQSVEYCVITMQKQDRLENIQKQSDKINQNVSDNEKINIQKIDAVVGANLDLNKLVNDKLLAPEFKDEKKPRKAELGCYLSHMTIYNKIKNSKKTGYTVIFEDDFEIVSDDFLKTVKSSLNTLVNDSVDFDMLFLGNNHSNYSKDPIPKNKGELLKDNIYYFNRKQFLYGTEAILINNANIEKIIHTLQYMDMPIDQKIQFQTLSGNLNILILNPVLVDQKSDIQSMIRFNPLLSN